MEILLQNALCLLPTKPFSFARKDVAISKNKIAKISPPNSLPPSKFDETIDCSNRLAMPGLVNAHVHSATTLLRGIGDDLQLHDWLSQAVWPREKKMGTKEVYAGAQLAIVEMLLSGTVNFNDMYFHMDAVAKAVSETGIRATLGYGMIDLGKFEEKGKSELAGAEKLFSKWEGKNSRITISSAPHAPYTCSKELLQGGAKLAKAHKAKMHIHLAETRKELADILNQAKKRPADYLDSIGALGKNTIAAHCVYVSKSEISMMAKRGVSVAHCPVSNLKLASGGAMPMPEMINEGVNIALGTDGAASNNSLDMFETAKFAALEQKNFRFDASVVRADGVLRMAFENGAKALGTNSGKIEVGCLADLILLDLKAPNLAPFQPNAGHVLYAAKSHNVIDVMVDGKWLVRDRSPLTLDVEKILEGAQDAAASLQ